MSETGSEMSLVGTTSRQFLRTYARHGSTSQLKRDSSFSRAARCIRTRSEHYGLIQDSAHVNQWM
jgi:hypothetical protein